MWIDEYNDELYHHGVKGMKWGQRKANPMETGTGRRGRTAQDRAKEATATGRSKVDKYLNRGTDQKKLQKAQQKWDKKYQKNYIKAYNSAADYANKTLIPKINAKYSKIIKAKDWREDKNYEKYIKEYESSFNAVMEKKMSELIGERPK